MQKKLNMKKSQRTEKNSPLKLRCEGFRPMLTKINWLNKMQHV